MRGEELASWLGNGESSRSGGSGEGEGSAWADLRK